MKNFNKNKIIMMAAVIVLLGALALYSAPGVYRTYKPYMSYLSYESDKTYKSDRTDGTNGTYTHPTYGFSFQYPDGFNVASFEQGEGEVVLIKGTGETDKTNRTNQEIQIYISPFDEPEESLTYERLRRDLPDLVIEDSKILTTVNDIKALMFLSRNESLGRTREIWFVYDKTLYQVTTYADMDAILEPIIKSWTFN